MGERITEAELTRITEHPRYQVDDEHVGALIAEIRRLRGLILRVGTMHPGESLAALAAQYGVERARDWAEVLDEAEAIRKEQGA